MKSLLLTFAALIALCTRAHSQEVPPAQVPPILFRMSSTVLAAINPNLSAGGDAIQVIVGTQNPKVLALRVTLIYVIDGVETTLTSQRPIANGFDIHSFAVPNYQVRVKSVTVQELAVLTEQTYAF